MHLNNYSIFTGLREDAEARREQSVATAYERDLPPMSPGVTHVRISRRTIVSNDGDGAVGADTGDGADALADIMVGEQWLEDNSDHIGLEGPSTPRRMPYVPSLSQEPGMAAQFFKTTPMRGLPHASKPLTSPRVVAPPPTHVRPSSKEALPLKVCTRAHI
jgi:hypothetical protein